VQMKQENYIIWASCKEKTHQRSHIIMICLIYLAAYDESLLFAWLASWLRYKYGGVLWPILSKLGL
jgi:hypothetical protein